MKEKSLFQVTQIQFPHQRKGIFSLIFCPLDLKRFSPMERFRGKLNVMVDFPLTGLDLSAFAAPRVPGCTYNLYGVANHSGTTYSGHYTAYCKHPYSGEWHEYNDSRVSVVSSRSVVSSEAYVLFYEQQPHSSHL